jgi:hypothetical protein
MSRSLSDPQFPGAIYFGARRFWRLSDLIAYERELAGLPPEPLSPAAEIYLSAAQVRARYGGVSDMWLRRRERPKHDEAAVDHE